jgi:hypothetical protein
MDLNPFRALHRLERNRALVRDEVGKLRQRHADGAYAAVLEKLGRRDLTSHYAAILRGAERALRPRKPSLIDRLRPPRA